MLLEYRNRLVFRIPCLHVFSLVLDHLCNLISPRMKYTNWVEFKIAAMTLFLHNPEIVDGSLYGLVFSSVTM